MIKQSIIERNSSFNHFQPYIILKPARQKSETNRKTQISHKTEIKPTDFWEGKTTTALLWPYLWYFCILRSL